MAAAALFRLKLLRRRRPGQRRIGCPGPPVSAVTPAEATPIAIPPWSPAANWTRSRQCRMRCATPPRKRKPACSNASAPWWRFPSPANWRDSSGPLPASPRTCRASPPSSQIAHGVRERVCRDGSTSRSRPRRRRRFESVRRRAGATYGDYPDKPEPPVSTARPVTGWLPVAESV